MILGNLIKKSFKTVVQNPMLTLFLVLFLIISNFFTTYLLHAKTLFVMSTLMLCVFLLAAVFVSGWFQVAKSAINEEKNKNYFPIFLEGIGKNLLSTILAIILYFILFIGIIFIARFIALKLFGPLDFLSKELIAQSANSAAFIESFNKLPINQQGAIYGWYFILIGLSAVFNFLLLFFFPSMFFIEDKNAFLRPFFALKNCLKFAFKNFFGTLAIYLMINISYFIIAILSTVFSNNVIISVLVLFSYIYFATITIMLLFNYYDKKANCNNRADSIGQNETND